MKKTTIILFSFALLLLIAGAVLCFIGTRNGDVFDNTTVTDEPVSMNINSDGTKTVKSIVVNYSEVTVNVYGNYECEHSYIQTINVDDKQIDYKSSTELNISDKKSFLDVAIDTIQNFSGLRNILFPEQVNTGAKTVNIYLSKNNDVTLTQLTVYADKGTVSINNMTSNTSYTLDIGETTDNITLDNVSTRSSIYLSVGRGSVSLKNNVSAVKVEANLGEGNFYLITADNDSYAYDLTAEEGTVYIFEDATQGSIDNGKHTYTFTPEATEGTEITSIIVNTKKGNISVKSPKVEEDQKSE